MELFANIAVNRIGADGVNRQVLLLYGALPAAVVNFVLTEKYRQDPDLAASIVVISTFISMFTIPIGALANSLAESFLLNLLDRQKLRRSLDSMNHSL
jgi:predicted permease